MIEIEELKELMKECDVCNADDQITNDIKVFEELGVGSLEIMRIICCYEDKYEVRLTEEQMDFEETLTVGELLQLLNSNLN